MGLSIHYSGTIRDISLIEPLIAETADVCQSMQWKYNVIREQGDKGVNGIVLSPENCEPVFITFLRNRRMCSPINPKYQELYAENGFDPELVYTTSTKTQYAGPATHVALLKFLKYQPVKIKRWHLGFFEHCRPGTEHKKCALSEYCQCAFYAELFSGFIDEDLTPEEERARALEIEVNHIRKKYGDEWMKYYPYHLDANYDDENGDPYDYGFGDEEDDEEDDSWWRK